MSKFLWACAALLTLFVTVESLMCYTCDVDFLSFCFSKKVVNCTKTQEQCFSAVATFNATDILSIYASGCRESKNCHNSSGAVLTADYKIDMTCCSTDLCNGAASIRLPVTAALVAALVALWSTWGP